MGANRWKKVTAGVTAMALAGSLLAVPGKNVYATEPTVSGQDVTKTTEQMEDAQTKLSNPRRAADGTVTWDCIYFGNYAQSDATGQTKEPIKWRVLAVDGDDAFVIADQCLDVYWNNQLPWKDSEVSEWLNNEFLTSAFTENEQEAIKNTTIKTRNAEMVEEESTNKIYLLSYQEAINPAYGFLDIVDENGSINCVGRERKMTAYVKAGGSTNLQYGAPGFHENAYWLLREYGEGELYDGRELFGRMVYGDGDIYTSSAAEVAIAGICPVLHLDLSSDDWEVAESVTVQEEMQNTTQAVSTTELTTTQEQTVTTEEMTTELSTTEETTTQLTTENTTEQTTTTTKTQTTLSNPRRTADGKVTWDCVYFGNYPQSDITGETKEPIKWRVLAVDGDDAFLMSNQSLDVYYYDTKNWKDSQTRTWLNSEFLGKAFTEDEQEAIKLTAVETTTNGEKYVTQDRVYCLSFDEAMNVAYGFSDIIDDEEDYMWQGAVDSVTRVIKKTPYLTHGGSLYEDLDWELDASDWALRGNLGENKSGCMVDRSGCILTLAIASAVDMDICPVLHINLSSDVWEVAESVTVQEEMQNTTQAVSTTELPTTEEQSTTVEVTTEEMTTELSTTEEETTTQLTTENTTEQATTTATTETQKTLSNPRRTADGKVTWDCVYFGNYPQSDITGETKEPIKWRVLAVDGDDAFLMSNQSLDMYENDTLDWKNSKTRTWLNSEFLTTAFTEDEQKAIKSTSVQSIGNKGTYMTNDKVYCLSYEEITNAAYGFSDVINDEGAFNTQGALASVTRVMERTPYLQNKGSYNTDKAEGYWALRGRVGEDLYGYTVKNDGSVPVYFVIKSLELDVCPVLHIDLSSDVWEMAEPFTVQDDVQNTTQEQTTEELTTAETTIAEETTEKATTEQLTTAKATTEKATTEQLTTTEATTQQSNTAKKVTKPAKVTGISIKAGKSKQLKLTWKKVSSASGYQVVYATDSKFKKGKDTITITKKTQTTKLLKKLKKNKKYYVKVRAYKKVNGKKVYGSWSKVVTKKCK